MDKRITRFKHCDLRFYPYLGKVLARLPKDVREEVLKNENLQIVADEDFHEMFALNYEFDNPVKNLVCLNTKSLNAPEYQLIHTIAHEIAGYVVGEGKAAFDEKEAEQLLVSWGFEKEVEAAKAQIQAAQAAVELSEIQLSYSELRAPFSGIIVSRNLEPGEVVSVGQEVISVCDLSEVDLKVFVDETEIGRVRPGQQVEVRIDTFPDKPYTGHVTFISPEGEFTPKIIQTHKERVKLVYLVKIKISNPNLELKSGMPADAWFR